MKDQKNIGVFIKDHYSFKTFATLKKKSMKEVFHEWVEQNINGVVKDE